MTRQDVDEWDRILKEEKEKRQKAKKQEVATPTQAAPEPSLAADVPIIGTGLLKGAADVAGIPADVGNFVAQALLDKLLGSNAPTIQLGGTSQSLKEGLGNVGLPVDQEASTQTGRFLTEAAEFAGGGLVPLGAAGAFAKQLVKSNNPIVKRLATELIERPKGVVASEFLASLSAVAGGRLSEAMFGEGQAQKTVGELLGALTPAGLTRIAKRAFDTDQAERLARGEVDEIALSEQKAREAEKALDAEGTLLPAQRTSEPRLLIEQEFLAQQPATSRRAAEALRKQNKEIFDLVVDVSNTIAPEELIDTAGTRIQRASNQAIELKKAARQQKVSPLYTQAFEEADANLARVNLDDVRVVLDDLKRGNVPSSAIGKKIAEVSKVIDEAENANTRRLREGVEITGSNLQALHGARTDLDLKIADAVKKERGAEVRALTQIRQALDTAIGNTSGAMKQADEAFIAETGPVEKIRAGVIGKIAAIDENSDKLFDVSGKLFSQNEKAIKRAKRVIEEVDPNAWRFITRAEIDRRLGASLDELAETENVINMPAKLKRALFGTPKQRQSLLAGLDDEGREAMLHLETLLDKAKTGRNIGSPTQGRQALEAAYRGMVSKMRRVFQPLELISGAGEDLSKEGKLRAGAELFFNPDGFNRELLEIKKSGNLTARELARAINALTNSIGEPEE